MEGMKIRRWRMIDELFSGTMALGTFDVEQFSEA